MFVFALLKIILAQSELIILMAAFSLSYDLSYRDVQVLPKNSKVVVTLKLFLEIQFDNCRRMVSFDQFVSKL